MSGADVQLELTGMTCSMCAGRIEQALNRLDGVHATVNFATEQAAVTVEGDADARSRSDELVAAVAATGYGARVLPPVGHRPHDHGGHDHGDHDAHDPDAHEHSDPRLTLRLVAAIVLAVPVIAISMIDAWMFDGWQWLALALTTPVVTWCAWPFHQATLRNLRHGATTMDTLISVGTLAAFGWSLWSLANGAADAPAMPMSMPSMAMPAEPVHHVYFEVAAGVTAFILAGRWAEQRAKRRAGQALRSLLDLGATDVSVIDDSGVERRIAVGELRVGDRFVVRPGEKVATDGVVVEGESSVDASLVTGESVPVLRGPGDEVTGATICVDGRLVVEATRVGADTQLAQISRLVTEAQNGKAPVQRLADRISAVFVPVVFVLAGVTLAAWLATGHPADRSIEAAVAVLIIACPCALGLATPTALLVGTGRGAQLGILIRGPEMLESTRRVDTIVLDKTGTVTTGEMEVVEITATADTPVPAAMRRVGAVEDAAEHPIARAIVRRVVNDDAAPLPRVEAFATSAGQGAAGRVDGVDVAVGRPVWIESRGNVIPPEIAEAVADAAQRGRTTVVGAWQGRARIAIAVADRPRPTSTAAVAALRELGLRPVLLSGDSAAAAAEVGRAVGIDDVRAEVLPADKVDVIAGLQREGHVVAMVGDGVNDAAAIAQADLGIAMGTGTDAAIEAGDLTLVRADLTAAVDAIRLSRRTLATIKANLFWAFAYNVAAIPVAALGLLQPMIAGAAMACSSVLVVTNSLRLRRFRPGG